MDLDISELNTIIRRALEEDIGQGDITTRATVSPKTKGTFYMVAREPLVACGLVVAEKIFREVGPSLKVKKHVAEGARVKKGAKLLTVSGPVGAILTAERVTLNFVQHLSAIATHTNRFVEQVKGTKTKILDTRKTTPGLRMLEKYAVKTGGGKNHRMRLDDGVLIKDNHISAAGSVTQAIKKARAGIKPRKEIEVECDTFEQVKEAIAAGADGLLLDNMPLATLRKVVALKSKLPLEASGGVTLKNVRAIAQTGVDYISIGGLTHSAPHVDIGLDAGMDSAQEA